MGKKRIWLTYAWDDNQDDDVDFVAQEIEKLGVEVRLDRFRLQTGKSLWRQIDSEIQDMEIDGWAIFVTESSLASPACREELDYALYRALSSRTPDFPIIGIFPRRVAAENIPTCLKTRLYVSLSDSDWQERIVSGIEGRAPNIPRKNVEEYGVSWSRSDVWAKAHGRTSADFDNVLEFWPRLGEWSRLAYVVRTEDADAISGIGAGIRGDIDGLMRGEGMKSVKMYTGGEELVGKQLNQIISSEMVGRITLKRIPSKLILGYGRSDKDDKLVHLI